jgi:hypothetical protein
MATREIWARHFRNRQSLRGRTYRASTRGSGWSKENLLPNLEPRETDVGRGAGMKKPVLNSKNGRGCLNLTTRLALVEGGVILAATAHPHLERALPAVLAMIDRARTVAK